MHSKPMEWENDGSAQAVLTSLLLSLNTLPSAAARSILFICFIPSSPPQPIIISANQSVHCILLVTCSTYCAADALSLQLLSSNLLMTLVRIYTMAIETLDASREEVQIFSAQPSPTVNLTSEYILSLQTNSYNEIWSKIHVQDGSQVECVQQEEPVSSSHIVAQLLQPDRASVEVALHRARPSNLTKLVSAYFDNSEHTSHLCLLLQRSIDLARSHYAPLGDLIDILPLSSSECGSLSQAQCDWAFGILRNFNSLENPFPHPNSDNFRNMRHCFSQLKLQLDCHLHKSRRKVRLIRRATTGSALCLIGTTIGVVLAAVVIAAHAFAALVAGALFVLLPNKVTKKELKHIAQLDATAKGTFVLNNFLDTIDRLVARLHAAIESDKFLISLGLERGKDSFLIQEVVKQLRKNQPNFLHQLNDLEEHLCLYFTTINKARYSLLQEIHLDQSNGRLRFL
ncbi:PREDICTED: UPF0496 protein At3g19330-like isoform X2 [Nelumbo nucifera]|uniref:UPF0496 protein At3g19330-like isoform X2 n=1 Tax=Nelumbo nucifera TaxID=4432 RepID=A0A1U8ASA3_NELNU|nr:PREDICTED: UPF0496 protein At3g19330-like isoform X2 [Nelumbo nucifera]